MRRSALLLAPIAVAALALAGCGSSDDDASGDTSTSSSTTSTTRASTTTTGAGTGTTAAPTPSCTATQLEGELGPTNAGAGQVYAPLILRNTSSTSCEVRGFPGVSLLDASGTQIGEPATREGAEGGTVLLQPGGVASATLHTTNEGIGGACDPVSTQMKVFPPGQTASIDFSAAYTACGGFTVTSLVPGDTGTA
jgi:hypothetical protein